MPVQPRPTDIFTRRALMLGFSAVEFTKAGTSVAIPMGILASQVLQKTIETLPLERGDAGTITVDRELVSSFAANLQIGLFNFQPNVAQFLFGGASLTTIVANATAAGNGNVTLDASTPFGPFLSLPNGDINEASIVPTFNEIALEAVGTGDGATGGTQGDFNLAQKIKAIGDVTSFTVGGVEQVGNLVAGAAPAAGQIGIEIGTEDSTTTGSGAITFGASVIPANGAAIVATYTPSFDQTDFQNLVDYILDPFQGRIRFLKDPTADTSPFRAADAASQGLSMNVAYTFNQRAATRFQPFTQTSFDGSARVLHLPDVGVNFIYTIPSASIILTDDDLTFGADDFAQGIVNLNINDAGGSLRFGTIDLSNEDEAAA